MKSYKFETANMGTCEISVSGEWTDGTKDLDVACGDFSREFKEMDGGSADEVFAWLISCGVEFESVRSLWVNVHAVASCILDGDADFTDVLDRCEHLDDADLADWYALNF